MIALSVFPRPRPERPIVNDLEQLVERALSSELFSAPHLETDSARLLEQHGDRLRELAAAARDRAGHVHFVGSGGAWGSMYSGKLLCGPLTAATSDGWPAYQLILRSPPPPDATSTVVLARYSRPYPGQPPG